MLVAVVNVASEHWKLLAKVLEGWCSRVRVEGNNFL